MLTTHRKRKRGLKSVNYFLNACRPPLLGNIEQHYLPNATGTAWVNQSTLTNVMNYKNASGGLNQLWCA